MNVAALVVTVVFLADDPTVPAVSLSLLEAPQDRRLQVVVIDDDGRVARMDRHDKNGRAVLPAGAFPMPPMGSSITPAVDGFIVTIEEAGDWVNWFRPPPVDETAPPTKKAKKPPPPRPYPPPQLPVAAAGTVRFFFSALEHDAPAFASIHGADGLAVGGVAVTVDVGARRAVTVDAAGVVDGSVADVSGDVSAGVGGVVDCVPASAKVAQAVTVSAVGGGVCGPLSVFRLDGLRTGGKPGKEAPAWGLLVWPWQPPSPPPPPPPTEGPAPVGLDSSARKDF
jgi:hypothetical protein